MKEITQDRFYKDPTPQSHGNCHQAATASILGLELNEVPSFHDCAEGFLASFHAFLKSIGYRAVELPSDRMPDVLYLAYGPSQRGVLHSCVFREGKLVWDPHPSRAGLLSVTTINLIVPIEPGDALKRIV